jgi:hypothetical protein
MKIASKTTVAITSPIVERIEELSKPLELKFVS